MGPSGEELYRLFGRLLEDVPTFSGYGQLDTSQLQWLGRGRALIQAAGDKIALAEFDLAKVNILGPLKLDALEQIMLTLHGQLAAAELNAPAGVRGAFIPVASAFDAFAAITKLFQTAKKDILIVDPYLDETILTEFGTTIPGGVALRLLSDSATVKASLSVAATKWVAQHGKANALSARLAAPRLLHDRAVFIDQTGAWTLTQSFKDFAKRSPAEIVRADDTAALKISAYENIWSAATVIV